MAVRAQAHANIALVKYWGKRDPVLNLPAAGSLSLTLEALTTEATVEAIEGGEDELVLDGKPAPGPAQARYSTWADAVRELASCELQFRANSHNNFPTASGLASSASGFAALALATSKAAGLDLDGQALSILARRGSGSAARSIFGGLVLMNPGSLDNGSDAFAEPIEEAEELRRSWPLAMVAAIVDGGRAKDISSRTAMDHCSETSPLYEGWLSSVPPDLGAARAAIAARDLDALGTVAEHSALCMHAAAMASRPPITYFRPTTLEVMECVRSLRSDGLPAYFTMDAGPHVKVLTMAKHTDDIAKAVGAIEGVTQVIVSGVGGPAAILPST